MLGKSVTLLAALLVTGGGFLAFESFTPKPGKAEGTRTVNVRQLGPYIANLCIKNRSKSNIEVCTGRVPLSADRDLTIPWDKGDEIIFIAAVVAGKNAYYGPIADRDTHCWSDGTSFFPGAYCRTWDEAPR
jgi:hypothetical protein